MSRTNAFLTLLMSCCLLFTTSCTRNIFSNSYSDSAMGEASETFRGVVVRVRQVKVRDEQLSDNVAGGILGALGGAIIGHQFGKGSGNTAATVGGALAGAVGGAMVEKNLKEQDAMEYSVQTDEGRVLTVVQGIAPRLEVGQRVMVMVSTRSGGRSRVVLDNNPPPPPPGQKNRLKTN